MPEVEIEVLKSKAEKYRAKLLAALGPVCAIMTELKQDGLDAQWQWVHDPATNRFSIGVIKITATREL